MQVIHTSDSVTRRRRTSTSLAFASRAIHRSQRPPTRATPPLAPPVETVSATTFDLSGGNVTSPCNVSMALAR